MKRARKVILIKNYHELDMIIGRYMFAKYQTPPKRENFVKSILNVEEMDMILSFLRFNKINDYMYTSSNLVMCERETNPKTILSFLDQMELSVKDAKENNDIFIYYFYIIYVK